MSSAPARKGRGSAGNRKSQSNGIRKKAISRGEIKKDTDVITRWVLLGLENLNVVMRKGGEERARQMKRREDSQESAGGQGAVHRGVKGTGSVPNANPMQRRIGARGWRVVESLAQGGGEGGTPRHKKKVFRSGTRGGYGPERGVFTAGGKKEDASECR